MPAVPRLKERYMQQVAPALQKELGVKSRMAVPGITKIVVSVGIGAASADPKLLESAAVELAQITGQKPLVCRARKSIANFRLRKGMPIGLKVTLRADRMWEFYDRLVNITIPRIRDLRGFSADGFDGKGNYTLGLPDQLVFPEVDYTKVEHLHGMNITIVTNAKGDEGARRLLEELGFPFARK